MVRGKKGEHRKILEDAKRAGYIRVRADGIIYDLAEEIPLDKNKKHTVEVIVDRIRIKESARRRLTDSTETALGLSGGLMTAVLKDSGEELSFSQNYACPDCGISLEEITPRLFSFNNPHGACPTCSGRSRTKSSASITAV